MATFSTKMDAALNGMVTAQKAAVKSAFTTVETALAAEQVTYGSPKPEKIALDEKLLALARDVRAQMR
jgi:hydroxylamine reductase (hybrid-cluster protein)